MPTWIIYDQEYIENMPKDVLEELIQLDDAIPNPIHYKLKQYNPEYKKRRWEYLQTHENIMKKQWALEVKIHGHKRTMKIPSIEEHEANKRKEYRYCIYFFYNYPQFEKIVKGLGDMNKHFEIIRLRDLHDEGIFKKYPRE